MTQTNTIGGGFKIIKGNNLTLFLLILGTFVMTNVSAAAKQYELHEAVVNTDIVQVRRLLQKGADINQLGPRRYGYGSALHLAVREGHLDIARLLIDWGAEVDVLDTKDFTPLHNAAWNGNLDMTELLLDSGADINASTYDGDTPLGLAQNNGHAQVAEFIQAKLQAPSGVATKVESTTTGDSGVIDISGSYLVDVSGEPKFITYILRGARLEDRPIFEMVQNGDRITVTIRGASSGMYGPIFATLDGNTVNMKWWDARAKMIVKPGGKVLVGTVVYTGGDNIINNAELKLTKIETEVDSIDISGTYIAETTASGCQACDPTEIAKKMNGKSIVLTQTGNTITGSVGSQSNLIKGTREGNIINFYIILGNELIGSWEINADATRLEGKWFTNGGGGASGIWNLTKVIDVSGTYIAETTISSMSGGGLQVRNAVNNSNGKLIVLKQTGNTITGSVGSKSNWIKGTREGNIINFYILTNNEIIGSWEINADAPNLEGKWFTNGGGGNSGKWNLTRIE